MTLWKDSELAFFAMATADMKVEDLKELLLCLTGDRPCPDILKQKLEAHISKLEGAFSADGESAGGSAESDRSLVVDVDAAQDLHLQLDQRKRAVSISDAVHGPETVSLTMFVSLRRPS